MVSNSHGVRIHIDGVVQGVGFRPFVFNLAKRLALYGWVKNTSGGVDIEADGSSEVLDQFINILQTEAPPLSSIDNIKTTFIPAQGFKKFEIIHSTPIEGAFQPISPDVSICSDCMRELSNSQDRRFRYPFINCTNCGPRYSIIKDIPYDRPNTTMAQFPMCVDCAAEYQNPADRRFHAQPVACPVCGPHIWLEMNGQLVSEREDALQQARQMINQGKILAVKGLGGFHLVCDATNDSAVRELRRRKLRVGKPFALMMADMDGIEKYSYADDTSREFLQSIERPIVILERRAGVPISLDVSPNQNTLGVMLPYTPLHYLLLEPANGFPDAFVMTSGNMSEEPIATDNIEARQRLSSLADVFLMHNRDIHIRCDDSVIRIFRGQNYPLRRSRGYAPLPVILKQEMPQLLATGAELKNTFCMTKGSYAFLSHHIGDLENYETLSSFEDGIAHFERLFRVKPEAIAYDRHPDYLATRYALERADRENIPALGVQHHHAHIAACMAEHGIAKSEPIIGIAFDGTGYGEDGAIWGGEVLLATYSSYKRLFHLPYIPLPGGDLAVREPWRLALAWLRQAKISWEEDLPPTRYVTGLSGHIQILDMLRYQLESKTNSPETSSMGRLFDAIAALVGLRQVVSYEAQAAIELETQAAQCAEEKGTYPVYLEKNIFDPTPLISAIVMDIKANVPVPIIAARFHNSIAAAVLDICCQIRHNFVVNKVALSGGVWQNITLLDHTNSLLLSNGFEVLTHTKVPVNDGGLALGQAIVAVHWLKEKA